jgi:hypothetical protein
MERKPLIDGRFVMALSSMRGDNTFARAIARAQGLTYQHTGHLIAINDEYIARRTREHKGTTAIPDLRVRCIFCLAVAPLWDWYLTCNFSLEERAAQIDGYVAARSKRNLRWLAPCDGEEQTANILRMLDVMCE